MVRKYVDARTSCLLCFEEVVMWYIYLEKVKRFDAFVFTCGSY